MPVLDIIKNIAAGENVKAQDEITNVLNQKALESIQTLKVDVAKNFFNGVQDAPEAQSTPTPTDE